MEESIATLYYRTQSPEEQRNFCISIANLSCRDEEMKKNSHHFENEDDHFQVMNTVVYPYENFDDFIEITGYPSEIKKTKSFLERKTKIKLIEADPNDID